MSWKNQAEHMTRDTARPCFQGSFSLDGLQMWRQAPSCLLSEGNPIHLWAYHTPSGLLILLLIQWPLVFKNPKEQS